jgi:small subunit ribosomal protein S17
MSKRVLRPAHLLLGKSATTSGRLTGVVVSAKMDKTVTVNVTRQVLHPVVHKMVQKSTKLLCHDEQGQCKEGDTVAIVPTRPISKRKHHVVEAVHRSVASQEAQLVEKAAARKEMWSAILSKIV